jgi:hypothetical protein
MLFPVNGKSGREGGKREIEGEMSLSINVQDVLVLLSLLCGLLCLFPRLFECLCFVGGFGTARPHSFIDIPYRYN